jgi:hypothetical protein
VFCMRTGFLLRVVFCLRRPEASWLGCIVLVSEFYLLESHVWLDWNPYYLIRFKPKAFSAHRAKKKRVQVNARTREEQSTGAWICYKKNTKTKTKTKQKQKQKPESDAVESDAMESDAMESEESDVEDVEVEIFYIILCI